VKLLVFQKHVIGLWKANNYLPRQNDNADETSVFLYIIQIYIDDRSKTCPHKNIWLRKDASHCNLDSVGTQHETTTTTYGT
jgi:hypothetical protein